jgi:hypothetical protein
MTMMLDPHRFEPADVAYNSSRPRLLCQWHRNAQGQLACGWSEVSSNDLDEPYLPVPAHLLPVVQSASQTTSQSPNCTHAVRQWILLALIVATAGLETVILSWVGSGTPL